MPGCQVDAWNRTCAIIHTFASFVHLMSFSQWYCFIQSSSHLIHYLTIRLNLWWCWVLLRIQLCRLARKGSPLMLFRSSADCNQWENAGFSSVDFEESYGGCSTKWYKFLYQAIPFGFDHWKWRAGSRRRDIDFGRFGWYNTIPLSKARRHISKGSPSIKSSSGVSGYILRATRFISLALATVSRCWFQDHCC